MVVPQRATPNEELQLPANSAFQSELVASWHHLWVARRPLAAPSSAAECPVRWAAAARNSEMGVREVVPVLRVQDARKSAEWYSRLGFKLDDQHTFGPGMPVYAFLSAGDQHLHLSEHAGDARPNTLLYLYVTGIDAFAKEFCVAVHDQPWAREISLEDPDGNRLRLGERPS